MQILINVLKIKKITNWSEIVIHPPHNISNNGYHSWFLQWQLNNWKENLRIVEMENSKKHTSNRSKEVSSIALVSKYVTSNEYNQVGLDP